MCSSDLTEAVVAATEVAVEAAATGEGAAEATGTGPIGMSLGAAAIGAAAVATGGGGTTGRTPPPTAGRGTNHPNIAMFTQKTAEFYRSFLDRLYRVADLLTDRPSPKPPDMTTEEEVEPQPLLSQLLAPALWAVVGSLTWTKKWTFEHFVKKKWRKVAFTTFLLPQVHKLVHINETEQREK